MINDDNSRCRKGLLSLSQSVMFLSLVSDALLITLSWCIRGEDGRFKSGTFYRNGFISGINTCNVSAFVFPKGASGGGGPPGTPIMPSPAGWYFSYEMPAFRRVLLPHIFMYDVILSPQTQTTLVTTCIL